MIESRPVNAARGVGADSARIVLPRGLADWLHLAATPTFAIMALLTGLNSGPIDTLCSVGPAAPLRGMAAMYIFMSVFHAPPWLKLIFRRGGAAGRS